MDQIINNLKKNLTDICAVTKKVESYGYDPLSAQRRVKIFERGLRSVGYATIRVSTLWHKGAIGCNLVVGPWQKENTLWLSAHNDYMGGVGAADNGTALAVLLEVARLLPAEQKEWVVFSSFAFEEKYLKGAKHFVTENSFLLPKVIGGFLNLECLGIKDWKTVIVTRRKKDIRSNKLLVKLLRQANPNYRPMICPMGYVGDSIPFQKAGVPVAELMGYHFEAKNPVHTEDDNIDVVDFEQLEEIVKTILNFTKLWSDHNDKTQNHI